LVEEESEAAAAHRVEPADAMAMMRDLCQDLLNPHRRTASPEPANAHDDVHEGEDDGFVPVADLEIPHEGKLHRFLTAYELDANEAANRLRKMLKWRASHSYGLDDTLVRDISTCTPGVQQQIATGKCNILTQRDKRARPIVVVHVRRHDPSAQTKDELTRFGVHILESAERILQETAVHSGTGSAEPSPGVPETEGSEQAMEPDKLLIIFNLVSHSQWHAPLPCFWTFRRRFRANLWRVPSPAEVDAAVGVSSTAEKTAYRKRWG
jgi:hypothetical protein